MEQCKYKEFSEIENVLSPVDGSSSNPEEEEVTFLYLLLANEKLKEDKFMHATVSR